MALSQQSQLDPASYFAELKTRSALLLLADRYLDLPRQKPIDLPSSVSLYLAELLDRRRYLTKTELHLSQELFYALKELFEEYRQVLEARQQVELLQQQLALQTEVSELFESQLEERENEIDRLRQTVRYLQSQVKRQN